MRVPVDFRSASKENYTSFRKKNPSIKLSYEQWKSIVYGFNDSFLNYILETGDKGRLPMGFGEFSINKKKVKKMKTAPDGRQFINLPVDWKKTKERGKLTYQFNYHTEGYRFRWIWFKKSTRIKNIDLWWFKPSRVASRLIAHYLKTDEKYQHLYKPWVQ